MELVQNAARKGSGWRRSTVLWQILWGIMDKEVKRQGESHECGYSINGKYMAKRMKKTVCGGRRGPPDLDSEGVKRGLRWAARELGDPELMT